MDTLHRQICNSDCTLVGGIPQETQSLHPPQRLPSSVFYMSGCTFGAFTSYVAAFHTPDTTVFFDDLPLLEEMKSLMIFREPDSSTVLVSIPT